jgi:hypothetical protein
MPLQPIPFCGGTYQDKTLIANAQESINLYAMKTPQPQTTAIKTEMMQGRADNIIMYPTPGYQFAQSCVSLATSAQTPIRALYTINTTLYGIVGNTLFSFMPSGSGFDLTNGTFSALGTLNTSQGLCSIECNTVQLAISDGSNGYTYTISSNTFAGISSSGAFPASGGVTNFTYYDGYIIGAVNNSRQVIQSNELDATTWQALAFDKIVSFPDNLVTVFSDELTLYCFGPKITEPQVDVGSIPYAFQKISGVLIQGGCLAWASVKKFGDTIMFLASDVAGSPFFATLAGYSPKPLSTPPINEFLARLNTSQLAAAYSWTYREGDNHFYCCTVGGVTWCYDKKMDMWHKRSIAGGPDLPQCYTYWQNNHVVGDLSGNLCLMSQNYSWYSSGAGVHDVPLARTRTAQHLIAGGMTAFVRELQIDFQVGFGFTPDANLVNQPVTGSTPLVTLYASRDLGYIWHNLGTRSLGAQGKYLQRVIWRNLGRFRKAVTFKVVITDPVAVFITGARADIKVGKK